MAACPPGTVLPWPLCHGEAWFAEKFNFVANAIWSGVNYLWTDLLWPKIQWLNEQVSSAVGWVWDQIKPLLGPVADWIEQAKDWAWTQLFEFVQDPIGKLTDAWNWIVSQVGSLLEQFKEYVSQGWNWIVSQLAGFAETLQTGISQIWTFIYENINAAISSLSESVMAGIDWLKTSITDGFNSLWEATSNGFSNVEKWVVDATGGLWDSLSGLAGDILSGVVGALGDGLRGFFEWMLKQLGWIAEMIVGAVNFVISKTKDAVNSIISPIVHSIIGGMLPDSPPPEIGEAVNSLVEAVWDRQLKVIESAYRSPPKGEDLWNTARDILAGMLGGTLVGMGLASAADLAHPLKDLGIKVTVREAIYWSGIPAVTAAIATTPTAIGLLEPLRYWLNEKLQPSIPTPTDIVRFAVREVFDPERRAVLLERYPGGEYERLMKMQGFRPEYAEMYWAAHWVLPSITQLNTMLQRQVIDRETWYNYVVYNDYIPEAVDWLEQIIYEPYTRVDARRMWALGVITDEELEKNYRDLGYDEEHARNLALWTKVYERLPDLERLYRNGWINTEEFKAELAELGLSADRIDWIFKTVVPKSRLERTKKERDLTKTDILRLHRVGEIDSLKAKQMLMDLGYDEDEAGYLIALNESSLETELRDLSTSQVLKAYRYEIMSRDEAKRKLLDIGWSENAAETLLKLEDVKLEDSKTERMRERDLSRTDIVKAIQRGIISAEVGYRYLGYLGYSDWEIRVIFALEGIEWPTGG